ncbi:SANT/Myb-like DNA-binding domain-containing protein [Aspergillus mulundensis]|uniref:Myb-like domain-containing protein n=1 Tax=Aspergillus mulundensis TaxID=1810919 RepID=A0A3D8T4F1_9EURO|nr:hypothetical protein DSM5745_00764 [Aspergillus mulundensis]RDW93442.1 hypothetical protein DSM5745_00764 [Aspergillus mulundensis]
MSPKNCWTEEEIVRLVSHRKQFPDINWEDFAERFPFPGRTPTAIAARWRCLNLTRNLEEFDVGCKDTRSGSTTKTTTAAGNGPAWSTTTGVKRRRSGLPARTRGRPANGREDSNQDNEWEDEDWVHADDDLSDEMDDEMGPQDGQGGAGANNKNAYDNSGLRARVARRVPAKGRGRGTRIAMTTGASSGSFAAPARALGQRTIADRQRPAQFFARLFQDLSDYFADNEDRFAGVEEILGQTQQHHRRMDSLEAMYNGAITQNNDLEDEIVAYGETVKELKAAVESQAATIQTLKEDAATDRAKVQQLLQWIGEMSVANRISAGGQEAKQNDSAAPTPSL